MGGGYEGGRYLNIFKSNTLHEIMEFFILQETTGVFYIKFISTYLTFIYSSIQTALYLFQLSSIHPSSYIHLFRLLYTCFNFHLFIHHHVFIYSDCSIPVSTFIYSFIIIYSSIHLLSYIYLFIYYHIFIFS